MKRVRTELLKQSTTRTFLAGVAAAPVVAGLVIVAVFGAAGKQGNDPLGPESLRQAIGAPASVITVIAMLLGVLGMAGEYRHQTITTTFLASPRRRDVVMAKLVAHSLTGVVMGAMSVAVSAAIAVPWLHSSGIAVHADADLFGVAAGVIASTALYGAVGVSVGALIRNQTVAISVVLVWLLAVEGLIRDLSGTSDLHRWLPADAGRAIVQSSAAAGHLSRPAAAAVFTAYVVALAAAGARFTLHRDIT